METPIMESIEIDDDASSEPLTPGIAPPTLIEGNSCCGAIRSENARQETRRGISAFYARYAQFLVNQDNRGLLFQTVAKSLGSFIAHRVIKGFIVLINPWRLPKQLRLLHRPPRWLSRLPRHLPSRRPPPRQSPLRHRQPLQSPVLLLLLLLLPVLPLSWRRVR
jgi:hypothetical protein